MKTHLVCLALCLLQHRAIVYDLGEKKFVYFRNG
jgi:hypothetical protein